MMLRKSTHLSLFLLSIITVTAQQVHQVTLASNQPPILTANAGPNVDTFVQFQVTIGATPVANGGTPPYTYSWTPTTNLSNTQSANPTLGLIGSASSYTVTVTDSKGCKAMDEMQVTIIVTSLDKDQEPIFSVYPNPATDQLSIKAHRTGIVEIRNTNSQSLLKRELSTQELSISLAEFPRGTYFVTMTTREGEQTVKIIIE